MATQSMLSLFPPLGGKEKAEVVLLNLRNRVVFQVALHRWEMNDKQPRRQQRHDSWAALRRGEALDEHLSDKLMALFKGVPFSSLG